MFTHNLTDVCLSRCDWDLAYLSVFYTQARLQARLVTHGALRCNQRHVHSLASTALHRVIRSPGQSLFGRCLLADAQPMIMQYSAIRRSEEANFSKVI